MSVRFLLVNLLFISGVMTHIPFGLPTNCAELCKFIGGIVGPDFQTYEFSEEAIEVRSLDDCTSTKSIDSASFAKKTDNGVTYQISKNDGDTISEVMNVVFYCKQNEFKWDGQYPEGLYVKGDKKECEAAQSKGKEEVQKYNQ